MKWVIEYYNEDSEVFVPLTAVIDQVYGELNGDAYASFWLPNTAENRALILQDLLVNFWFDNELQFTGVLSGADITSKNLKAVVYEVVPTTLECAEPLTGVYDQKSASLIIADILAGTGLSSDAGSTPTAPISVVFYNANRLDCLNFVASAVNQDYWSIDGATILWGARGSGNIWTPQTITLSKRGIDRSKKADKVIVRGIDTFGYHIKGEAGSGSKVRVFNEATAADQASLANIAAKKLVELKTDSSGLPVNVLITEGCHYNVGDSVTISNAQYLLDGTYRIMQLTKHKTQVSLQLDKARSSIDKAVADLSSLENKGIFLPGSTSWSLNLQGLIALYHLNEGAGETAKDSAPVETPNNGTIVNGNWQEGPITKILTLNGSDAYVNLGDASKAGINFHASSGVGKFSVGAWFSPSALDSTDRYIAQKADQFVFKYKVSTGVLTFGFRDSGGTWRYYDSNSGVVTVGGRLNAVATYDGVKLKLYINGYLHKEFAQTTNIYDSANTVYLGVFLKGVLAEVMLWSRALVDQEVLELYFFPLLRVVGKGGHGESPTNDVVRFKIISVGWTGPT